MTIAPWANQNPETSTPSPNAYAAASAYLLPYWQ